MKFTDSVFAAATLALMAGAVMTPSPAGAAVIPRTFSGNASNYCQSALPVFDVQIRKRPLAVQNEGDRNGFVTCSFDADNNPVSVTVFLASTSGAPASVSCTGVGGTLEGGPFSSAQYAVKTVNLAGDGTQAKIMWEPGDFAEINEIPGGVFGISCNLPPETGVNDAYVMFGEQIGD